MKKNIFAALGLVFVALAGGFVYASYKYKDTTIQSNVAIQPPTPEVTTEADEEMEGTGELTWVIDEGYRLDEASNPRIMSYEDGVIHLGHEYQAKELKDEPGRGSYVAMSEDGLNFSERWQFQNDDYLGDGILLPNGNYIRYREDSANGYVLSQTSVDGGETWEEDEGYRFDLNEIDEGWIGVRTFWVDEDGGVGMIYNTNQIFGPDGEKIHAIRMAYSEPGDNGMNFEVMNENLVVEFKGDSLVQEMTADPHAIQLPDGRVRMILMRQDYDRGVPPQNSNGAILSYISEDGFNFQYEGEIVSWDDFEEWDVMSLNDPKIMALDDGRFRVYVAAMIPDPEVPEEEVGTMVDGKIYGYKWILVSITTE